jgi:glycosyltransferase involved in cell wall biosynthesis
MAKILQVCNTEFYLSKFLSPLILALVREGHHVECLCESHTIPKELLKYGVIVHYMKFPKSIYPLQFLQCISEMRKLLREKHYNCVNSHNRNASIIARVATWLEKVPINLYTAHGFYFHDEQSKLGYFSTLMFERILAKITDFTLSQSDEDTLLMTKKGYIKPKAIKTIGNGIDTSVFKPTNKREQLEKQLKLGSCSFRVAATGRLVKNKGFMDLLNGFAKLHHKHSNSQLLLIGGNVKNDISPFKKQLIARIKELNLEHAVIITGVVDNVEEYLAICDVFVLPSYREGMPRSLLEAMSTEIPVIATNIRGCREAIVDGENGYLYTPHDVNALAKLLNRTYKKIEERKYVGKNARSRIVPYFDEKNYVNRQLESINQLVANL